MLKQLRIHLTLICTLATGAILIIMAIAGLSIAEYQLKENNASAFQSHINTLANKLQSDNSISYTWLSQTEASEELIIHIEDKGAPLSFPGGWTPSSPRKSLIKKAQEEALAKEDLSTKNSPLSSIGITQVTFNIVGDEGDHYIASLAQIPIRNGYLSLTLLKNSDREISYIRSLRLAFFTLTILSVAGLSAVSWWFCGRAIKPIEDNSQKQSEFIAAASHELRSPLAVIQASASVISTDPKRASHFAGNIENECKRLARLVDDLLLLAGSDAKTWTVKLEPVDIDTLLIETFEKFYPLTVAKQQRLSLEVPDDTLPKVNGDFQRLQQILSILIDNAISYTPVNGKIVIKAYSKNSYVIIEVLDNGPGIPKEHQAHIFDRFYRADKSRNAKSHFGLGLSIAKELTGLHRGRLFLKETPSEGCCFVIELPIK